jgi:outer membrane protein assembly factor BamB
VHNRSESVLSSDKLSELTEAWRIDGIGGVAGTPAVVNGVIYFGDWHGVVHLLEYHFPVREGQVDNLAAKH